MFRRQFLATGAGVALAAAIPAGRGMAATPADQFVIAINMSSMRGLDPHEMNQLETIEVMANCYDRLLAFAHDNLAEPQGQLAESWTVSDDGLTFTFTLRDGVTFHSGNPLTAADVEWSLRRLVKLELSPSIDLRQWGFSKDNVDALIRATDARTLVVETPELWNPSLILASLATSSCSVVDSAFLQGEEVDGDMGRAYLATQSAGSGPFVLRQWRANDVLMADAYEGYWGGVPAMRRVIMKHLPESAAQRLQLQAGDVDVATRLSSTDLEAIDGVDGTAVQMVPGFGFYYVALNQEDEILSNPLVREAFRYLIDYDGLAATVMKFYGIKQQSIIPAGLPGAIEDMPYSLDIDKAKELLAEAGYAEGFTKTYYCTPVTPEYELAQALQANAALAGITLNLEPGDHLAKFRERDFEVFSARTGERLPDPHAILNSYATNPDNRPEAQLGGLMAWRAAWDVPAEIQELVVAAAHETDNAVRAELYRQANTAYLAASPALVTSFQRVDAKAVRAGVAGYHGHPTWVTRWDTVTKG